MQREDFPAFLARFGPLPAAWPPGARAAALALLARDGAARAMQLEAALAASLRPAGPEALARMQAAVAQRIARMPLPARPSWAARWLRPLLPAGAGAVAALLLCALWLQPEGAAEPADLLAPRLTLALAFGDGE